MGLLTVGQPMDWESAQSHIEHVKKHGLEQFLTIYKKNASISSRTLVWGEELEYIVVKLDHETRKARLSLRADQLLRTLNHDPAFSDKAHWHPEYASYMIEATPESPYDDQLVTVLQVEANMNWRRKLIQSLLEPNELLLSIVNFYRLGCPDTTSPPSPVQGPVANSLFVSDAIINPHPRFATLTRSIRERRGSRVNIQVPIYKDINTPTPFAESVPNIDEDGKAALKPDHIYMDAMGFGMGCCCLQITFQAQNLAEATYLYDQLSVMTSIMLAVSAASPIYRGYLSEIDCRWNVISASVDDRTPEEFGLAPLSKNKFVLPKSRYGTISSYLNSGKFFKDEYQSKRLTFDHAVKDRLVGEGVEPLIAEHIAHIFTRDPLVVFKETLHQDNDRDSDHFESIQSTNWQTMRFKPPPPGSSIGWRVEFRPMDIQITDFENAALSAFVNLLARVILAYNLDLYIPIDKNNCNIQRSHFLGAILKQKFHFRTHVARNPRDAVRSENTEVDVYTVDEIINGKLVPLIREYLAAQPLSRQEQDQFSRYIDLVSRRAAGSLMTPASYLRKLVAEHPDYKQDSVVSDAIAYDLCKHADVLGNGVLVASELTGDLLPSA